MAACKKIQLKKPKSMWYQGCTTRQLLHMADFDLVKCQKNKYLVKFTIKIVNPNQLDTDTTQVNSNNKES